MFNIRRKSRVYIFSDPTIYPADVRNGPEYLWPNPAGIFFMAVCFGVSKLRSVEGMYSVATDKKPYKV